MDELRIPDGSIVIRNAMFGQNSLYPPLDFVSAQLELDDTEMDLSFTHYENVDLSDWEKRTLLARWFDSIGANDLYDYIVIDCPPATKIVSQNALAASNSYVIPVIPEDISSHGVTHFQNLVKTKIDDKLACLKTTAGCPMPIYRITISLQRVLRQSYSSLLRQWPFNFISRPIRAFSLCEGCDRLTVGKR